MAFPIQNPASTPTNGAGPLATFLTFPLSPTCPALGTRKAFFFKYAKHSPLQSQSFYSCFLWFSILFYQISSGLASDSLQLCAQGGLPLHPFQNNSPLPHAITLYPLHPVYFSAPHCLTLYVYLHLICLLPLGYKLPKCGNYQVLFTVGSPTSTNSSWHRVEAQHFCLMNECDYR